MRALIASLIVWVGTAGAVELDRRQVLAGLSALTLRPRVNAQPIFPAAASELDLGLRPLMWQINVLLDGPLKALDKAGRAQAKAKLISIERALPEAFGVPAERVQNFFDQTLAIHPHVSDAPLPLAGRDAEVIAKFAEVSAELGGLIAKRTELIRGLGASKIDRDYELTWRRRVWGTMKMHNAMIKLGLVERIGDPNFGARKLELIDRFVELEWSLSEDSGLPIEIIREHAFYLDETRSHYPRRFEEIPALTDRLLIEVDRILPGFATELVKSWEPSVRGSAADVVPSKPLAARPVPALRLEVAHFFRARRILEQLVEGAAPTRGVEAQACPLLLEHQALKPVLDEVPAAVPVSNDSSA